MKTVTNLVSAVGEIVDRLTLPGREKKQLETDILQLLIAVEEKFERSGIRLLPNPAGCGGIRPSRDRPERGHYPARTFQRGVVARREKFSPRED